MKRQFEFVGKLNAPEGVAFGLQQPTITGRLAVGELSGPAVDRLESALSNQLQESLPPLEPLPDAATRFAQRLIFLIGAIQRQAGLAVSERYYLQALPPGQPGSFLFQVAFPYLHLKAALIAANWTIDTLQLLLGSQTQDPPDTLAQRFGDARQKLRPFVSSRINDFHLLNAANRLDIPVLRVNDGLVSIGTGSRSRWFRSTLTDRTPGLAIDLAHDKFRTAALLRMSGLPGARHVRVASSGEAVKAAEALGYPVVIKPADQEQGRGVHADLRTPEQVARYYESTRKLSSSVLVEKWVAGQTHRLTVFQGEVLRVTRRQAGGVLGDGIRDVATLIVRWQQDPDNFRRSQRLGKVLLELDDEARDLLAQRGLNERYVPAAGEHVRLRRRDNLNTGGINEFVELQSVHPENLQLAVTVATLMRLDFAGIDLITTDIAQPWYDNGAAICEVNAQPQLGVSHEATLFERILRQLGGDDGLVIPAHLVICPNSLIAHAEWLAEVAQGKDTNGLSCANGLWINDRKVSAGFSNGYKAAKALLLRPDVDAALCLMTPTEVTTFGLPINRWDSVESLRMAEGSEQEQQALADASQWLDGHLIGGVSPR